MMTALTPTRPCSPGECDQIETVSLKAPRTPSFWQLTRLVPCRVCSDGSCMLCDDTNSVPAVDARYVTEELRAPSTIADLEQHYGGVDDDVFGLRVGERAELGGGCFVARVS